MTTFRALLAAKAQQKEAAYAARIAQFKLYIALGYSITEAMKRLDS